METTFKSSSKRVGYYGGNIFLVYNNTNWSNMFGLINLDSLGNARRMQHPYAPIEDQFLDFANNYRCIAIDSQDFLYIGGSDTDERPEIFYNLAAEGTFLWTKSNTDFGYEAINFIYDVAVEGIKYWTEWQLVVEPNIGFSLIDLGIVVFR